MSVCASKIRNKQRPRGNIYIKLLEVFSGKIESQGPSSWVFWATPIHFLRPEDTKQRFPNQNNGILFPIRWSSCIICFAFQIKQATSSIQGNFFLKNIQAIVSPLGKRKQFQRQTKEFLCLLTLKGIEKVINVTYSVSCINYYSIVVLQYYK